MLVMYMNKPNILFLFSDQHNAKCLSCAGHPDVKTPNLDRIAANGVSFSNAYTNNPICTPSRMSYLSSLYPSTHGYYGLYGREPTEKLTSMFAWFSSLGYRTGALGKLHTPRYWIERDCDFIYDEFIEFPKYLEAVGLYEKNDNRKFCGGRDGETSFLPLEHCCETALAKQAARFIDNLGEPADRVKPVDPWFAFVSFSRPHEPYTPSAPYAFMYPAESLTLPPTGVHENPETMRQREHISEELLRKNVSAYLGLVSQTDYGIGLVLEHLEKRGLLNNTIIVYASDHGDYAGEHGLFEKRGGLSYNAITRVPMIFRVPGASRSMATDEMAEAVDVFPTLCTLAGLPAPDTVQGVSLLTSDGAPVPGARRDALTENPYRKAIADRRWRFIANLPEEKDELYDQQNDPWEQHNLIDDPSLAESVANLRRRLLYRVSCARQPITAINGFWHRHEYDRDGRANLSKYDINPYW